MSIGFLCSHCDSELELMEGAGKKYAVCPNDDCPSSQSWSNAKLIEENKRLHALSESQSKALDMMEKGQL